MNPGHITRLGALVAAATLVVLPAATAAAEAGATCCFVNQRFAGPCAVTLGEGETCTTVLSYLNGMSGVGKMYCGNTTVRGGWTQAQCASGDTTFVAPDAVTSAPPQMYSSPGWGGAQPSTTLQPMVVTPGSVVKVSLDDSVDLATAPSGTSFAAHLDADLMVDGAVAAPRGSAVYGRVVKVQGQAQPVMELTDVTVDGQLVPVVADAATQAPVGLPVSAKSTSRGEVIELDPAVALFLTGDVAGAVDLTRATIQVRRQEIVAANLGLAGAESEAFWPVYRDYRAALDQLGARDAAVIVDFAKTYEGLSDEKARALLDETVAVEAERAKLRQKYVERFAKVLPGVKLARFYQIENKLDAVIRMELAAGIPLAR